MKLNKLGVWYFTDVLTVSEAADLARLLDDLGYGALWYAEGLGRNSFAHASWLLANSKKLVVATGIANVFARDAQATLAARNTLDEQSHGRFLLGLGVSHRPLVEAARGHAYERPLSYMRTYLEKMQQASYNAPMPEVRGELVIAALGPKMLELARDLCDGAHPYNVTPEHTAKARAILGPQKKLYVEQKVLLEVDALKARAIAKATLEMYLPLPNYRNNWLGLGFSADEIDKASHRFLDAIVAWGDEDAVGARIQAHLDAGADHVCIQPLSASGKPDLKAIEAMAKRFL